MENGDNKIINPETILLKNSEEVFECNKNFPFEKLEEYLLNTKGVLCFKSTDGMVIEPPSNTSSLIELLYWIASTTRHTYTFDQDNNLTDNRLDYRSIGDLFLIAKYYRPEVTIKEVYRVLVESMFDSTGGVSSWLCAGARKVMYFTSGSNVVNNLSGEDEYGFIFGVYKFNNNYYSTDKCNLTKIIFYDNN
jgi:hypothetical protein